MTVAVPGGGGVGGRGGRGSDERDDVENRDDDNGSVWTAWMREIQPEENLR